MNITRRLDTPDRERFVAAGLVENWVENLPHAVDKVGHQSEWAHLKARMATDAAALVERHGKSLGDDDKRVLALAIGVKIAEPKSNFNPIYSRPEDTWKWIQGVADRLHNARLDEVGVDPALSSLEKKISGDIGFKHSSPAEVQVGEVVAGAILADLAGQDQVLQTYMPNDPLPADATPLKGWEKLRGWFRCDGNASSPIHKAGMAVLGGSTVAMLAKAALVVAAATGPVGAVVAAVVAVKAFQKGYQAADLLSGIGHHKMDEYPRGPVGREFNRHHVDPDAVSRWGFARAGFQAALAATPIALGTLGALFLVPAAAGGLAAAGVAAVVGGVTGAISGLVMTVRNHGWAHMQEKPLLAKLGMKLGLVLDGSEHERHHADPDPNHGYCVVNGQCNDLLDNVLKYPRRAEKIRYLATGEEAECWSDPAVKAEALAIWVPGERFLVPLVRKVLAGNSPAQEAK